MLRSATASVFISNSWMRCLGCLLLYKPTSRIAHARRTYAAGRIDLRLPEAESCTMPEAGSLALHAKDVTLARACAEGDANALAEFERTVLPVALRATHGILPADG